MKTFQLRLLSPERPFYEGECVSLTFPIEDGLYGVMANHTPLTAAVIPGIVSFVRPDGDRTECVVSQGLADVDENTALLLCDKVLLPEEVDEAGEAEEARLAEEDMQGRQSYQDYRLSRMMFTKEAARLRIKKHDAAAQLNQR